MQTNPSTFSPHSRNLASVVNKTLLYLLVQSEEEEEEEEMKNQPKLINFLLLFFLPCLLISSNFNVSVAAAGDDEKIGKNPFTVKASLLRYWNQQISNNLPKPSFLISKASPLTSLDSAFLTKLADQNSLSTHFSTFCSSANLVCFTDNSPSLEKHTGDVNFAAYTEEKNFTNYGDSPFGVDSFKNYSGHANVVSHSFRQYSRNSDGHTHKFANYAPNVNVHDGSFNTYGSGATAGSGEFKNYVSNANVPDLRFTSYESDASARKETFAAYSENSNGGVQSFTNYGKKGQIITSGFSSYGKGSNVIGSAFTNYAERGGLANDSFISYSFDTNDPANTFKNYGHGGILATESFNSYTDKATVGEDSFQSYAEKSKFGKVDFTSYGKIFHNVIDRFSGYGKGSTNHSIGFKLYGNFNTTFTDYAKKGISFAKYNNKQSSAKTTSMAADGTAKSVQSTRWVEPGKFFRESNLKQGNIMPLPDIRDKMPKRSFLPRSLSSKIPFSTSKISQLKQIFHASENSSMENILKNTLEECERAPSKGETKRCVGSIEDMIDFAVSVLGRNVVVRSIEGVKGSKKDVMLGVVKGINGGKITRSVSCHQSLYPYLVYYCHSVPQVRVYVAEILDVKTKQKINTGTAICHVDTSAWSPGHGSFAALGSSPGKIEVCHWIFEGDMTWARAD